MRTALALFIVIALAGCGAKPAAPAAASADPCAVCTGSDSTGAVCEDIVPADTGAAPPKKVEPTRSKPEPEPTAVAKKTDKQPRLWEFGRGTCIPCKTMKGILDPMIPEFAGKVEIRMLNIDDEPTLTKQFRIQMIPTQVFIDIQGKELFRHVGVFPRDSIMAKFKEFGW